MKGLLEGGNWRRLDKEVQGEMEGERNGERLKKVKEDEKMQRRDGKVKFGWKGS